MEKKNKVAKLTERKIRYIIRAKKRGESTKRIAEDMKLSPPDVQGRDVTVADGFLPADVGADALDRQIDFDEALGVRSHGKSKDNKSLTIFGLYHRPDNIVQIQRPTRAIRSGWSWYGSAEKSI